MSVLYLENAVYSKLTGRAQLTALVGGSVSPRIYNLQAPAGAVLPYVIFYVADGAIPNETPRQDADYAYRAEAVAETPASARAIHTEIFNALDREGLTVTGWSNWDSKCTGVVHLVENADGRQYWRVVGDYRFKLAKDG